MSLPGDDTTQTMTTKQKVSALLIDLSGTLHIGDTPTSRAVDALRKLRAASIPIRFCSNTSKESSASLLSRLRTLEFEIHDHELFTSLSACRSLVDQRHLKPYLLLSGSALEDFHDLPQVNEEEYDSVIVGLAPDKLDYAHLNQAFRILSREPIGKEMARPDPDSPRSFIATHEANYVRASDQALSLGPGPFVHALARASAVEPEIVGKPSKSFFELTLASLVGEGVGKEDWAQVGIVGDDVVNDLGGGAEELGLKRFLVRTGKYRPGDEKNGSSAPDGVFDCFADLVDHICLNESR